MIDLGFLVRNHVRLNDGTVLSIQASKFHYCWPKVMRLNADKYTHFEVCIIKGRVPERFMCYHFADVIPRVSKAELIRTIIDCKGIETYPYTN